MPRKDLTGQRYGRLTAIAYIGRSKVAGSSRPRTVWSFQCDCGNVIERQIDGVLAGHISSCGCLRAEGFRRVCEACGNDFVSAKPNDRTCSTDCLFTLHQNAGSDSDCWFWTGPTRGGYGVLSLPAPAGTRKTILAHRYAYERSAGPIPPGMLVMHSCDNPLCVNPRHLSAGTWRDNNEDRSRKGRSGARQFTDEDRRKYSDARRGEKNFTAKLTESQAIEILHAAGAQSEIARRYKVSKSLVGRIKRGQSWSHLPRP